MIISDGKDLHSMLPAYSAMAALERCTIANFYPILVSAGSLSAFSAMQASNASCIMVNSTSASDLQLAFDRMRGKVNLAKAEIGTSIGSSD